MADAAVTLLVENLGQILLKEAELLLGVNEELQSLSVQLKVIGSFLKDFERVRHEHESVETVVNQIRDVAYDAADIIEEFVASALKRSLSWKRHVPGSTLLKQRNIAKRIKDVKRRTEEIHSTKDSLGIDIKPVQEVASEGSFKGSPKMPPVVEEVDVVGFTNAAKVLVKQLIRGDLKLSAVSIVGMGGLGKTTLAKKICNDVSIKDRFRRCIWVYVSQEHTLRRLILDLLKCLGEDIETIGTMKEEDLGRKLHTLLKGWKYLVVMDDVWQPEVWKVMSPFFPDEGNGSRILFTTRVAEVALYADSIQRNPPHYLRLLNTEESWELFRNKALLDETISPQWEELGRRIATKCGGLPLAIVVLGSLLTTKNRRTFDEWSKVAKRVTTYLSQRSAECSDILALSYHELPYYVKPCFLYFGVFPEDSQIPARQLIQLWVAEGFIKACQGEKIEDTAERYLEMLIDRSLIHVAQRRSDRGVKICSIHDLLRDLCISEACRERIFYVTAPEEFGPVTDAR